MKPVFIIVTQTGAHHDYTPWVAEDGLKPADNDLDANGSGRNLLDGLMYRSRIATKDKWAVTFLRLDEDVMAQLMTDMKKPEYVSIRLLDPDENRYIERPYYTATINKGVQRYIGGHTVYDGVTFSITER